MRARVTTVTAKAGMIDEFIKIYTESTVPVALQQDGFEGALLLVDRETNKTIVISMWESEEKMKAGEASGYYQEQIRKRSHLLEEGSVREYFDIGARAWGPAGG
ncbi:MAG: antibiotic biosynthesis monooxygenase [Chloroflexi bacterium]|nr:antibiotic biosynthesis monooxygenase [Chloroflexota bacterium]